jgi:hypothetical protein
MAHDTILQQEDPPARARISQAALLFGVLGAPAAWAVQLWSKYSLNSHACFPGSIPFISPAPETLRWLWPLLLAVDIAALAIGMAAVLVSYRNWIETQDEHRGNAEALAEIGEGGTRFFALWGMIGGAAFSLAILFDLIGVLVLPLCG